MDTIDRAILASLAQRSGWPSVSIYAPTHLSAMETEHDRIRLRNMLAEANSQLIAGGMRAPDAEDFLGEAESLLTDPAFWRRTAGGLAVFASLGNTRVFQVDTPLPEEVVVGDRFHIRPLALAYHGDEHFFALALDLNRARLFAGDHASIHELAIEPPTNADMAEVALFVRDLEHEVARAIGPQGSVPLILFGVEDELAAYREANTYPALAEQQVVGATDELTLHDIHVLSLRALAPILEAVTEHDLTELRERPSARTSDDVHEIVSAAAAGRVESLFFDEAMGPFGHFDRDLFAVSEICESVPRLLRDDTPAEAAPGACGWDLVDLALAETVLHGGEIHAFAGEDAPVHGVAALLRY